ncbi:MULTISPECIES: hypothetical protein [unclassified Helicobacter]|uniref:hypothetical protein n=1 Tax=unclassified Helicobacter TaxID=2593540 RepID=UPI0018F80D38|nr:MULTISPECIES: hypothetical protein [unclassified Helicobacter]
MKRQEIGSFWHTREGYRGIGLMELLSIKSFLDHGYKFTLYTYNLKDKILIDLCNLFDNFSIEDGNKLVPFENFFLDDRGAGIATFSDYFRYRMLDSELGKSVWVDLDMVCLNFYDFSQEEYIFSQEIDLDQTMPRVTNSLVKFPKNSSFGKQLILEAENIINHRKRVPWAIIGPSFLAKQVKQSNLERYNWDYRKTCQISWGRAKDFIKTHKFDRSQPFLHLYSEMWNTYMMNRNYFYKNNIYGELLEKHEIKKLAHQINFNFTFKDKLPNFLYHYLRWLQKPFHNRT